jgi:hypothetical protein
MNLQRMNWRELQYDNLTVLKNLLFAILIISILELYYYFLQFVSKLKPISMMATGKNPVFGSPNV